MCRYKYIFFDLDGTLTDPGIGITSSVMYALKKYNIEVNQRSELYKFIGPPLLESFVKYYNFTEEEGNNAVKYFREYFKKTGIFENELYEDTVEVLTLLKEKGYRLILATSKPIEFALTILNYFDLMKYFDFVGGASMDETRRKKEEVIEYVISSLDLEKEKNSILMVGDRKHDIIGATMNNIDSCGVLYGYGTEEELKSHNATYIINSLKELLKIV